MPKVLHVITGLGLGGAETALYRLLGKLSETDFTFRVVSLTDEGVYGERIAALGIPVTALHMPRGRLTWRGLRHLHRILREWQPDVVHSWMYHANLVAWLADSRRAQIWGLRQSPRDAKRLKFTTRTVMRLNALAARSERPQRVVVNAAATLNDYVRMGFPRHKLDYIPNGFSTDVFRPMPGVRSQVRKKLGLPEGAPLLGLFARLHPIKGHDIFFAAAEKVLSVRGDVHFLLCGPGITADNPQVQAWLPAAHKNSFRLQGPCTKMPRWYAALDGLVLASFLEGFPNVLGEAMACGVPCVSTDVGDAARIIGETGFIVPPGDQDALADAMLRLLALPPEARQALGMQARQRIAREFSLETVAQQYAALYRSLL